MARVSINRQCEFIVFRNENSQSLPIFVEKKYVFLIEESVERLQIKFFGISHNKDCKKAAMAWIIGPASQIAAQKEKLGID